MWEATRGYPCRNPDWGKPTEDIHRRSHLGKPLEEYESLLDNHQRKLLREAIGNTLREAIRQLMREGKRLEKRLSEGIRRSP